MTGSAEVAAPRRRRAVADPARRAAYDTLRAVAAQDAYANLVLPGLLRERGLSGRDAAFATELTYGALRAQGTYDAVLAACVDRPLARVDPEVLDVLRLGCHQLLGMRVAPHAAVSATVELVRGAVGHGPAGFVNAVLRHVAARDLSAWVDALAPSAQEDPVGRLAIEHAHPRWVVEAFGTALGGDLAETAAALRADNVRPLVTLVARPGRAEVEELLAAGASAGLWSPYAAVLAEGNPAQVPAVAEGRAGVQDEGSQLVALALAGAPLQGRDERWLDLCAGPGGKAALLAGLAGLAGPAGAGERGARLVAAEKAPHRARLVARALGPMPNADVLVADSTVPAWVPSAFDRVLVDAPCTGLGALRRRPEARWRRRPEDLPGLVALQRALLAGALVAVRPGGLLAYATCSPHPAETAEVVAGVLEGRSDIERVDVRPYLPDLPQLGPGPDVQLWPHRHGTDAMYLALLRRR